MPRKSDPFSIRLSPGTDELISREARRTRRSKGAVVEALAEEALRTRRFPGIAFRGSDWDRRPWVMGTAMDVWEIVWASRSFSSPGEMAGHYEIGEAQVRLALAYYREYPDAIDERIRDSERSLEELQREHPSIDTIAVDID
ncbi:MAG: hypothetical protein ACRDL4_16075 [Thermoleophilaceae bacterium]